MKNVEHTLDSYPQYIQRGHPEFTAICYNSKTNRKALLKALENSNNITAIIKDKNSSKKLRDIYVSTDHNKNTITIKEDDYILFEYDDEFKEVLMPDEFCKRYIRA